MHLMDWLFSDMYRLIFIVFSLLALTIVAPSLTVFSVVVYEKSRLVAGYIIPYRHLADAGDVKWIDRMAQPGRVERHTIAHSHQTMEAERFLAEAAIKNAQGLDIAAKALLDVNYVAVTDPYRVNHTLTESAIKDGVSVALKEEMNRKSFEEHLAVDILARKVLVDAEKQQKEIFNEWEGATRYGDDSHDLIEQRRQKRRKLISQKAKLLADRTVSAYEKEALVATYDSDIEFEGDMIERMERQIRQKENREDVSATDEADDSPAGA